MKSKTPVVYMINADEEWSRMLTTKLAAGGFQVRTFVNGERFLESFEPDQCHCAIIDLELPEIDGLTLQRMILDRQWQLPIIFITRQPSVRRAVAAMRAGALTVLDSPANDGELLGHVREALAIHTAYQEKLIRQRKLAGNINQLTPRQRQVLDLIVQGKTTREIADHLFISIKTVETHREHIMRKLAAHNVADVVRIASAAKSPPTLTFDLSQPPDVAEAKDQPDADAAATSKRQGLHDFSPLAPADPEA